MIIRFVLITLAIFATTLSLAHAERKDTLVIGITQFPANFHPSIEIMLAKFFALNLTMRPITTYDKDWNLVCMLCTKLPTIENGGAVIEDLGDGKKGVAVTYTLQPDAKWGDGTPVTTRDVQYAIEVGKHPQSGVAGAESYRRILSVDVIDDKTFTVHVDRVHFKYNDLAIYVLPEHIDRPTFAQPGEYRYKNSYDTDSYNPGLYFGPYRISHIRPGSHIEFVRNETWWGKTPYFEKIILRVITNTAALEANLLSGSIDFMSGVLGVTLDQALALQQRHPDRFNYVYRPGLIYEHIDLNLDNPTLQDVRVRKALIYAIDRQTINDQLFNSRQPVADVYVSPLDPSYNNNVHKYKYDPKKANQLLDEAGWTMHADSIRRNVNGESLMLEFGTTAGARVRETIQQVLQSQWREVGIDVRIHNQPARVFFGDTVTKRLFSGLAMFAWISNPETVPRTTLHSSEIPTAANNWQGSNYTGYINPKIDELIDLVEVTLNPIERHQISAQIQDIYVADLPVLPLYYRAEPFVIPKWLHGIEPTGNTSTITLWAENWSVDEQTYN